VILLSTSTLAWYWLHRIFEFAKKSWFDGIDISLTKSNHDFWDAEYIKRLSIETWIQVVSITAPSWWMDEKIVDRIVSIAMKLWTQIITFSPPHISDKNTTWFTNHLLNIKKNYHISVSVKNVEPAFLLFIIPKYKNSSLSDIKKITWDTSLDLSCVDWSNWIDIIRSQKILWNSVKNIYLNDKFWTKSFLMPWTAWWWISYLPIESLLMKLKTNWYNWFFTLKVHPKEIWVWNNDLLIQNLEYCISYYKKHFLDYK